MQILTGLVAGLIGLAFGTVSFGQVIGPATPPPLPQGPSESMQRLEQDLAKEQATKRPAKKKKRASKPSEKERSDKK